jgi:hypothetical protein
MRTTYELVLPCCFVQYLEGIHLLQTRDAQGDLDGKALLRAWDAGTFKRGTMILTIDFTDEGRGVMQYLREYAETVAYGGSDYTRGERVGAYKALERITEINTRFRQDVNAAVTPIEGGWTVAYRKPKANRFVRVDGVSVSWEAATELSQDVIKAMPGYEVYYVSTRQAELQGLVCEEDRGNILVPSGRRVRIVEGGTLPEGVTV